METKVKDTKKNGNRVELSRKLAIKAMLETGGTIKGIARQEKLSPDTVHAIAHNVELNPEAVEHIKKNFSAKSYLIGDRCANLLLDSNKLDKASAYQLAGIRSYSLQDARLIEGQSTQNIAYADVSKKLQSIDAEIASLEAEVNE